VSSGAEPNGPLRGQDEGGVNEHFMRTGARVR